MSQIGTTITLLVLEICLIGNNLPGSSARLPIKWKVPVSVNGNGTKTPLLLHNRIAINSLSALNLMQSEFELDFFLFQRWYVDGPVCSSYREIHRSIVGESDLVMEDGSETITDVAVLTKIWLPQTYMQEVKSYVNTKAAKTEGFVTIYNQTNGCTIKFTRRMFTSLGCRMDFREYPNDIQNCSLTFTGYYWPDNVLQYQWDSPDLEQNTANIDQNHYGIQFSTETTKAIAFDGKNRTWLKIRLVFRRKITHFIYQAVVPSILIISAAYFSFFISVENGPNRFLFTATPFFALITLYSGVKGQLPPVSYITSSDIWMLGTLIFDFSTICVMSYCCYLTKLDQIKGSVAKNKVPGLDVENQQPRKRAPLTQKPSLLKAFSFVLFPVRDEALFKQADHLDNLMKLIFPLLFVTFNFIYWALVLSRRLLT